MAGEVAFTRPAEPSTLAHYVYDKSHFASMKNAPQINSMYTPNSGLLSSTPLVDTG